jgi:hypothetical protein
MTRGVDGSTIEAELEKMRSMRDGVARIGDGELRARVARTAQDGPHRFTPPSPSIDDPFDVGSPR